MELFLHVIHPYGVIPGPTEYFQPLVHPTGLTLSEEINYDTKS